MKWRSVEELPKISGSYIVVYLGDNEEERFTGYVSFSTFYGWNRKTIAWLDPEVPEHFLKPKEPEKKPCPWCKTYNWKIVKFGVTNQFYYVCEQKGCKAAGPERDTYAEAEAAIFERVK